MGTTRNWRRSARTAVGALLGTVAIAACTPVPGAPSTTTTVASEPTAPVVSTFVVKGGVNPAPSLVALAWNASDANGDQLTCSIDGDGNGSFEITVPDCGGSGSRNAVVAAPGPVTATLRVSDGNTAPVSRTVSFAVPAGTSESFDIELRGIGDLAAPVAAAFQTAVARWEGIITHGLPDVAVPPRPGCLPSDVDDLPAIIDDLLVDVSTPYIDGPGEILGQAGPTCVPLSTELGFHGIMEFDSADVAEMISDGSLTDVITHELGHVLGLGTLWDMSWHPQGVRRFVSGIGGANPTFVGSRAAAEWDVLGGNGNVPVENSGGPGTRDSHWRELTFGNELMTGYISPSVNPLSRMTIASMADLGYRVDVTEADAYTPPPSFSLLRRLRGEPLGEVLRPPVGIVG